MEKCFRLIEYFLGDSDLNWSKSLLDKFQDETSPHVNKRFIYAKWNLEINILEQTI